MLYNVTRLQGQDVMPELREQALTVLEGRTPDPEIRERVFRIIEGIVVQAGNLCWNQFVRMIGPDENLTVSDYRILENELLYIVVE